MNSLYTVIDVCMQYSYLHVSYTVYIERRNFFFVQTALYFISVAHSFQKFFSVFGSEPYSPRNCWLNKFSQGKLKCVCKIIKLIKKYAVRLKKNQNCNVNIYTQKMGSRNKRPQFYHFDIFYDDAIVLQLHA